MPKGIYKHKKLSEEHKKKIGLSGVGRIVTPETRIKISIALKNEKHFNWKDEANYEIVHYWINSNYGKACICEGLNCNGISKTYDWALIKGKEYQRDRESFMQLCRSCHVRYDRNDIRTKPNCIDCGIELKDWKAKRCNKHAQQYRFKKN